MDSWKQYSCLLAVAESAQISLLHKEHTVGSRTKDTSLLRSQINTMLAGKKFISAGGCTPLFVGKTNGQAPDNPIIDLVEYILVALT